MNSPLVLDDIKIIDVDAHISEPHDLWSSRAPASLKDRLPRVVDGDDGQRIWVVEDHQLASTNPGSVVRHDGQKSQSLDFFDWKLEDVHRASWDMKARVEVLDETGIYAQIIYPNLAGFGNQNFMKVEDQELRQACVTIYNDYMAEVQADSNERILPMALMPWWNIDHCVAEIERAKNMGLRGIVMCSDPDSIGLPDLGDDSWTPFWEACNDFEMPINFHIGASETAFNMFGRAAWPSMGNRRKLALGSAGLFFENSRVLGNILYSGVLERFQKLKIVSVESGIGWIPFMLEALDHEWSETGSVEECKLPMPPSEYFKRHVYGCFWFEKTAPKKLIEAVGEDNILFETDFPHPTCLYPDVKGYLEEVTADWSDTTKRKILRDNAAALYKINV